MKFINKTTQFQSDKRPFPTYIDSYVKDGKIEVGRFSEYLDIEFLFCHQVNNEEIVINSSNLRFTDSHIPTYMTLSNGDKIEVYEAILTGETYDKSKIADEDWGKPNLHKVMGMFELTSLTNNQTGLVIKNLTEISVSGTIVSITQSQSAQIRQLMIDWLKHSVYIENERMKVNFEIQ